MRRFKLLDTIRRKSQQRAEGLVIRSNLSAFGETVQIQWFDRTKDTIMHADNLELAK